MTKKYIVLAVLMTTLTVFSSCHHATLEDKAEKIANDYTERNCPTPVENMTITDSITFDRETKTFNYYYTLTDKADNAAIIDTLQPKLSKSLIEDLKDNTSMKAFKDASYNFHFVFRSKKTGDVLFERTATPKDYQSKHQKR